MKKFLKIVLGIVAVIAVGVVLLLYFTSGARDTARNFLTLASSGDAAGARALLHPELQKDFTVEKLAATFAGAKPYTEVSFGSVSAGSGQATELSGTATTADGCESVVEFKVLGDAIIGFDISPLCRE